MISIVVAYHNRKPQFKLTLESIKQQGRDDVEVIAVDDRSRPEGRIEDLRAEFNFLRVIRLDSTEFRNPCLSYNIGFKEVSGDVVIIQNPECVHAGNIIATTEKLISDDNYLSFGVYSASIDLSSRIAQASEHLFHYDHIRDLVLASRQAGAGNPGRDDVWYNHSVYSPRHLHFTTAITRNNLERLNGFDERYALGMDYDDDELRQRIIRMGLKIQPVDDPFSIHLWHESHFVNTVIHGVEHPPQQLSARNKNIFVNHTLKETHWKAVDNEYYNCDRN